jgi:hypothetical protein
MILTLDLRKQITDEKYMRDLLMGVTSTHNAFRILLPATYRQLELFNQTLRKLKPPGISLTKDALLIQGVFDKILHLHD